MNAGEFFTYVLENQDKYQPPPGTDTEEGECFHPFSQAEFAEQFGMTETEAEQCLALPAPSEVSSTSKTTGTSKELPHDFDYVEVEDMSKEEYPFYYNSSNQNCPEFTHVFYDATEEEIQKAEEEKLKNMPKPSESSQEQDEIKARTNEWKKAFLAHIQHLKAHPPPPSFTKFYHTKGRRSQGQILSWGYFKDIGCYAIKRERGIEYYKRPTELRCLPGFDLNRLNYLDMLYINDESWARYLQKRLRQEFVRGWSIFKPQKPKRIVSKKEFDPVTGRAKVTLIYKPPKTLKKIPLMKLKQDFYKSFVYWYYDGRTHEAVIALLEKDKWDMIRIFDPMWLTNLSREDIATLYKSEILYAKEDRDQALMYRNVIRICFAFDIHAGTDWKEQQKKYFAET